MTGPYVQPRQLDALGHLAGPSRYNAQGSPVMVHGDVMGGTLVSAMLLRGRRA